VDILVWTIAHRGLVARVAEDGKIDGDPELVAMLRQRMREPVLVYRRGTVQGSDAIELQPGDRRYVVARVRTLCDGESEFEVTGCEWR
jgi:hypothetical protein